MDSARRERLLTQINLQDVTTALGVQNNAALSALARRVFRIPARRFARQLVRLDDETRSRGLRAAAQELLPAYADRLTVRGVDRLPRTGPLLILSNHPGMSDALALLATIPRDDLVVLAIHRPVLRVLRTVCQSLIAVPPSAEASAAALRLAVAHLRAGKALLTFPAGTTEADPEMDPGAVGSLSSWSASPALLARLVPETTVVPAVVRGVLAPRAQRHLITRLRRTPSDRQLLGSVFQVMVRVLLPGRWPVHVRLDYLEPIPGHALAALGRGEAMEVIRASCRRAYAATR